MRLTTRIKRRLRSWWRRRLRTPLAVAGAVLVGLVLLVNLLVRFVAGGNAFPLSPSNLPQKIHALGLLARHAVVGRAQPADPAVEVRAAARRHGVPMDFALAVARVESGLDPIRISPAGAMGLMQLVPASVHELEVDDPFDARESAEAGVRYLAALLARYHGDQRRAAAAYNCGPGLVPVSGDFDLPAETKAYVHRVLYLARSR